MPVRLDQPDRTQLASSPLTLVVFQLRFETNLLASEARTAREFHQQLGGRQGDYPVIEPVSSLAVQVASFPGLDPAVSQRQSTGGWRFRSDDAAWVVSLMPDSVSLETSQYGTWEQFRERLAQVIGTLQNVLAPVFEQRLGLRYVNQIAFPDVREPGEWEQWIRRELLGPLLHERLMEGVTFSRQQLGLDLGDDVVCSLSHGSFPTADGEGLAYLLDYDVFRQTSQPFAADDVLEASDNFNTHALALFQLSVTRTYLERAAAG
ncbi:MAG: TIGR04255 family protein [Gaiellaceae bacterium]